MMAFPPFLFRLLPAAASGEHGLPSGPREILEDGKWGRLVPVGDEEALAAAMRKSLDEEHDPERLRRRAMDFSVDQAVDNYLDVLFPDG